jgi:putative ABC transport system ATP-binding protein
MHEVKLLCEGISRRFFRNGKNTNFFNAVEKTFFELPEGAVTEIVGRSGSGKTTFANILSGLLTPTEGVLLIDGVDFSSLPDEKRSQFRNKNIGIVPQGQTGLSSLTVLENVLAPAFMYGDGKEKESLAKELLSQMDLFELCDVYSNELSGGELRRMSIARALINSPKIIIADEPTGDLDDDTTRLVLSLFRKKADEGASVLIVTHEHDALQYADQIYRMEKGVLSKEG